MADLIFRGFPELHHLFFTIFCIIPISWGFVILMDMYNSINIIIKSLNYILTI